MIRDAGYGPKLVREFNERNIPRLITTQGQNWQRDTRYQRPQSLK